MYVRETSKVHLRTVAKRVERKITMTRVFLLMSEQDTTDGRSASFIIPQELHVKCQGNKGAVMAEGGKGEQEEEEGEEEAARINWHPSHKG